MDFLQPDPLNFTVGSIQYVNMRQNVTNWSCRNDSRESYSLAFVFSGAAKYHVSDNTFTAKKGDILFFRKGDKTAGVACEDSLWSCVSIAFDLIFMNEESRSFLYELPNLIRPGLFSSYANHFLEIYRHRMSLERGSLLKCRSLIADLLYMLIQESQYTDSAKPHYDTINGIKNFLIANYSKSYQLDELAAMAELSNSHFRKLFKEYTGDTVLQFQNRLKITKACDLLQSGDCNVTETAYAVGINDIYYFSRLFKKFTGSSPSQYMRCANNPNHQLKGYQEIFS